MIKTNNQFLLQFSELEACVYKKKADNDFNDTLAVESFEIYMYVFVTIFRDSPPPSIRDFTFVFRSEHTQTYHKVHSYRAYTLTFFSICCNWIFGRRS